MNFYVYDHCSGSLSVPANLREEVQQAIGLIAVKPKHGAARKLRESFLDALKALGWSGVLAVSIGSDMTITSTKERVGLCLQTGNMARIYADLIKLQALYLDGAISSAVIVLPSQPVAQLLGSNIAQAKRLERELDIFKKAYHVPTLIFALE